MSATSFSASEHDSLLRESNKKITEQDLSQFTGTEHYYKFWCGVCITDGVKFLTEKGLCWLMTDICSYWTDKKIREIPFQVWTLKVESNKKAELTMQEDSDTPVIIRQNYDFTDCPLKEIKLYLIDGILLLSSEY